MKLRQKLAMVLATAMVVTAVPVVTFAATTNSITNPIIVLKDDIIGAKKSSTATEGVYKYEKANSPELVFDFTNTYNQFSDEVYVEFANAEVSDEALILAANKNGANTVRYTEVQVQDGVIKKLVEATAGEVTTAVGTKVSDFVNTLSYTGKAPNAAGTVTVSKVNKTTLKIELNNLVVANKNEQIRMAFPLVAKEGDITATISRGAGYISNGTFNLSKEAVSTKGIKASLAKSKNLTIDGGEVAAITLDETVQGAIAKAAAAGEKVTIELDGSADVVFNKDSQITLKGKYGLTNQITTAAGFATTEEDKITIDFSKVTVAGGSTSGAMEIAGIKVKPESRKGAQPGTVKVRVESTKDLFKTVEGQVAEIKDFGSGLAVEKPIEVVAGKKAKEVTFTLTEDAAESLSKKHDVYFEIEGAEVTRIKEIKNQDGKLAASIITSKLGEKDKDSEDKNAVITHVNEFELKLKDALKESKANKITITLEVQAEADYEGDIVVTAESRSFDKNKTVTIGKVTPAMAVKVAETTVKVGLNNQEMGAITIKEANKGMLAKGEVVVDLNMAIGSKKEDIKVEGTGTLEAKVKKVVDGKIYLEVTRESREIGELKISGVKLNVNRTVAEGASDIVVSGKNTVGYGKLTVKDAIVVGTKNTEDLTNGMGKIVTTIANGATEMIVNKEKVTLPAAAFINDGKLMAPLRAVSKAFGIDGKNINYNAQTKEILIFGNGRTIQLTIGSKEAFVNGAKMTLASPATIKANSTYVPVGDLGRLLGLTVKWDGATKTATFSN